MSNGFVEIVQPAITLAWTVKLVDVVPAIAGGAEPAAIKMAEAKTKRRIMV
ncbi:MAG: hypothetical protein ACKO2Z_27005 [Sphaerospermopsis kisseleviana]